MKFFLRCIVDACIFLWDIIIGTGRFCAPTLFSFEIIDRLKRKKKIAYRASFIKTENWNSIINKKQILKIDSTILDRRIILTFLFFLWKKNKNDLFFSKNTFYIGNNEVLHATMARERNARLQKLRNKRGDGFNIARDDKLHPRYLGWHRASPGSETLPEKYNETVSSNRACRLPPCWLY